MRVMTETKWAGNKEYSDPVVPYSAPIELRDYAPGQLVGAVVI